MDSSYDEWFITISTQNSLNRRPLCGGGVCLTLILATHGLQQSKAHQASTLSRLHGCIHGDVHTCMNYVYKQRETEKRDIEPNDGPNVAYNCVPGTPSPLVRFKADRLLSTYTCLCKIQLQTSLSYLVKNKSPIIHIYWCSIICNSL